MFHCRCVKTKGRFEIQYVMNTNKYNPVWITYEPYTADRWDSLVFLVMQRKHVRYCSVISQKQFDIITEKMLECSSKGYMVV